MVIWFLHSWIAEGYRVFNIACPGCSRPLMIRESMLGTAVRCPGCSHHITLAAPVPHSSASPPCTRETSRTHQSELDKREEACRIRREELARKEKELTEFGLELERSRKALEEQYAHELEHLQLQHARRVEELRQDFQKEVERRRPRHPASRRRLWHTEQQYFSGPDCEDYASGCLSGREYEEIEEPDYDDHDVDDGDNYGEDYDEDDVDYDDGEDIRECDESDDDFND